MFRRRPIPPPTPAGIVLAALYRRVQTTKATQAQELLAKRSQNKEK